MIDTPAVTAAAGDPSVTRLPWPTQRSPRRAIATALALALATLAGRAVAATNDAAPDMSHAVRPGFGSWWLPYNYSRHGPAMDQLFNVIFWITMVTFVLVELTLVYFVIKYRSKPGNGKAKFLHGNTRLEMIWTLIPAVILAVLALFSKGVWDRYRYADEYYDAKQQTAEVLVIGEQFKWNFVYPGKDHKLGQYLVFPQPSDPDFRKFPKDLVLNKINTALTENPLGQNKDFANHEAMYGADDDYDINPSRPLFLPVDQPIAVKLSSKDVIHDFYLPNFRVKLDALPGMAGRIDFTANTTAQCTADVPLEQAVGKMVWIDAHTRGAKRVDASEVSQVNYGIDLKDAKGQPLTILSRSQLTADGAAALKAAGHDKVTVLTHAFDLVCEELCGQGHYSMGASVYFLSKQQYADFVEKPDVVTPTTQPQVTLRK